MKTLIERERSVLIVIDMQERLAPAVREADKAVANARRLIEASKILDIPWLVSEQYPKGLGHSIEAIAELLPEGQKAVEKFSFSCWSQAGFQEHFKSLGRSQAILAGMECHVCVLQTALEMVAAGIETFLVADAASSRSLDDKAFALERMRAAGVSVVSSEMVLFEWLRQAGTDTFRRLLPLIK